MIIKWDSFIFEDPKNNLIFAYLNKNIDTKTLKTLTGFFKDVEELENILKIAKDQPNINNLTGWLIHASKNKDNYTTENYVNTSTQSAVKKNSFTNYTGELGITTKLLD